MYPSQFRGLNCCDLRNWWGGGGSSLSKSHLTHYNSVGGPIPPAASQSVVSLPMIWLFCAIIFWLSAFQILYQYTQLCNFGLLLFKPHLLFLRLNPVFFCEFPRPIHWCIQQPEDMLYTSSRYGLLSHSPDQNQRSRWLCQAYRSAGGRHLASDRIQGQMMW